MPSFFSWKQILFLCAMLLATLKLPALVVLGSDSNPSAEEPQSNERMFFQGKELPPAIMENPVEAPEFQEENIDVQQVQQASQREIIDEVILAQCEAMRSGDFSKAYYAYMSTDFQDVVSLETFKLFVRKNRVLAYNSTFVMQGLTFSSVIATVKGVLKALDGSQAFAQYDLIQENGIWKIRKIELSSSAP